MSAEAGARAALVADLEHEAALTRLVLARVPDARLDWSPHPRSFSLGALADHLGALLHWGVRILDDDGYDLARAGAHETAAARAIRADPGRAFDRRAGELRDAIARQNDAGLAATWTLRRGDAVVAVLPKSTALRYYVLHHLVHHRGQLTVYLRLLGEPLPVLYGPTADEGS